MKVRDLIKYLVDCGMNLDVKFLTQSGWTDLEEIHIVRGDGTVIVDNPEIRRLRKVNAQKTTQLKDWAWRINEQHAKIMELECKIIESECKIEQLKIKNNVLVPLLDAIEQLEGELFGGHEDNAEMARPLSTDSSFN